jgi:hypothetical protein
VVRARLDRKIDLTSLTLRGQRSHRGWSKVMADHYVLRAELHHMHAVERAAFVAGDWAAAPPSG